jgi:hypothetical protein
MRRYGEDSGFEPGKIRNCDESHVRVVSEIRQLAAHGITPSKAGPFVECLGAGHVHSDECPARGVPTATASPNSTA